MRLEPVFLVAPGEGAAPLRREFLRWGALMVGSALVGGAAGLSLPRQAAAAEPGDELQELRRLCRSGPLPELLQNGFYVAFLASQAHPESDDLWHGLERIAAGLPARPVAPDDVALAAYLGSVRDRAPTQRKAQLLRALADKEVR